MRGCPDSAAWALAGDPVVWAFVRLFMLVHATPPDPRSNESWDCLIGIERSSRQAVAQGGAWHAWRARHNKGE